MHTRFKVQLDLSFNVFCVTPAELIFFSNESLWALGWCGNSSNGLKYIRKHSSCVVFYSFTITFTFDISEEWPFFGINTPKSIGLAKRWPSTFDERRLMDVHPLVGLFPWLPLWAERDDCWRPPELWIQTFRLALSSSVLTLLSHLMLL